MIALQGKLRIKLVGFLEPERRNQAEMHVNFIPKHGDEVVIMQHGPRRLMPRVTSSHLVIADKTNGVYFDVLADDWKSWSPQQEFRCYDIQIGKYLVDFEFMISGDGMIFVHPRIKGGKWGLGCDCDHGDSIYYIVQAANGLGFITNNNQPEYWPPTDAIELNFKVLDPWEKTRYYRTDPRKVMRKVQTATTLFRKSPLPKGSSTSL